MQAVGDFLSGRTGTKDFVVAPTYMPGVRSAALGTILPDACSASLARALRHWEQRVPGFGAADVPLTGVEARSSAPCRILRDTVTMQSVSTAGLYPIGGRHHERRTRRHESRTCFFGANTVDYGEDKGKVTVRGSAQSGAQQMMLKIHRRLLS